MSPQWDTIVIGAGLGGLSAAAHLVKAGLRVLVLDKSPHAGGTAHVYTRKGFTFPMGPLGFSTPELVRKTLSDLNQEAPLHFCRVHYQIRAFNVAAPLSLSFDRLQDKLAGIFPDDAGGIKRFFEDMANMISAMQFPEHEENRLILEKTRSMSAQAYIEPLITDWRLRRILGSIGTREPYSSIALLAAMWNLMVNEGIWYPKGGMGSFCDRFVQALTKSPQNSGAFGKIRLGVTVKQIRVKDGRALGVTLEDGTKIDAEKIISNADYKTTFLRLFEPGTIPERWRKAVAHAKQAGSVFQVCLGVDKNKVNLAAFSVLTGSKELDWSAREADPQALAGQELEISILSREDPMLASEGGSVIVIRTEADHGHFAKYRAARGRIHPYRDYKTRLARGLVSEAAHLLPGLEEAIQVVDVATPLTFEDQGGRSQGAVAGWSWNYEDNPDHRPVELIRTPIRGLYMVGYQAYSALFMGGVPTAIASGQRAAELLLEGAGPLEELGGNRGEA
jgi:phytoene dehydrogenase-like protein